jgi:hypothetical protein
MININKNKRLFVRQLVAQQKQLEIKLFRSVQTLFKVIFDETAGMIVHGDPLNLVPVIVNKHTIELRNELLRQYRMVGLFAYKQVIDRLEELNPKKSVNYSSKIEGNDFWYYFDTWVKQQAMIKVTQMNETSKNILRTIIDNGVKAGKSYKEIAKDLRNLGGISSKNRAMTIAITETHTAFNKAIFQSIESNSVKIETKEWINAGDERVRNTSFSHIAANGEKVPMKEYFVRTGGPLMYPGDPSGAAGNIIRCRCATLYNTEVTEIE